MTATNHGLFGSLIAITLQNYPAAAVAISPFSHFFLDAIPHYADDSMSLQSKKFKQILLIDCTLAVVSTLVLAWFWQEIALLVVVCAFLAASPDLMWIKYQFLKPVPRKDWPWFARFHSRIQWSQTPPGAIVELLWFAVLFPVLILLAG